jgi:hypothetical protein
MKVLLVNDALLERGGSESYLQTISWALRRLGHSVSFFSSHLGGFADALTADGFEVFGSVRSLPGDFDVVHGQHVSSTALVRARLTDTPLLFATHSWFVPIEDPLAGFRADAFLAFNDVTLARVKAHSASRGKPVYRLTQPVDITFRDSARTPIASVPQAALAVSRAQRRSLVQLQSACERAGISLTAIGLGGVESSDARNEMLAADIVFATGRSALEAMAAGKAVFIIDESTIGGWVTADSYESLEADGFTGIGATPRLRSLETDFAHYSTDLGRDARRLAVHNHSAQRHVAALVEIYDSLRTTSPPAPDLDELRRLTAENMGLQSRLVEAEWANAEQVKQIHALRKSWGWLLTHPQQTLGRIARRVRRAG